MLQRHVELLVGDEELRADVLAAVDLLLGVCADTSGGVPGKHIFITQVTRISVCQENLRKVNF